MAYDASDPRAAMASLSTGPTILPERFARAESFEFGDLSPDLDPLGSKTWYCRGQNFIVAYSLAEAGAELTRKAQPDEYAIVLPERGLEADVVARGTTMHVPGYSVAFVPPGESTVRVGSSGGIIRLFSAQSTDLAAKCVNAGSYAEPHPSVAEMGEWPEPPDGQRVRVYSFDVPPEPGRLGRIWRSTTIMLAYSYPWDGPRDVTKLAPHSHPDFEQGSLAIGGEFVHHLRWPWIPNMNEWLPDQHIRCGSPSFTVIPPHVIHTSQAVGSGANLLIDVFCPGRSDWSRMPGWVLNASDYPGLGDPS